MRHPLTAWSAFLLMAVLPGAVLAADDENARLREMLHRTQEALRQAQSDNAELTRAKLDTEHKLDDASKQIDGAKSSARAAQSGKASLQTQLDAQRNSQVSLQHSLDDANNRGAVLNGKVSELLKQLGERTTELKDARQSLEQAKAANVSCETKNSLLYQYSTELLDKYQNKGVWASLSQKDPVLGLKKVDVENVMQEYRLKADDAKVQPAQQPATP